MLDKYQQYIGVRYHADVLSMSAHIACDTPPTIVKHIVYVDAIPYAEIVGSLLYLAVVTRMDIMYFEV